MFYVLKIKPKLPILEECNENKWDWIRGFALTKISFLFKICL